MHRMRLWHENPALLETDLITTCKASQAIHHTPRPRGTNVLQNEDNVSAKLDSMTCPVQFMIAMKAVVTHSSTLANLISQNNVLAQV